MNNVSRLERLVGELREFYGLLPTPPSDAFMLFVWDVLSFQAPPLKRDTAFGALKRNRSLTPDSMSKVAPKKLEESVKLCGSYIRTAGARAEDRHHRVSAQFRAAGDDQGPAG